jgi:ubiquitin carboxyl-terminal hydrolase 22/27/51
MQGERQQDSHEWYLQIIDKLHECEKPSYDSRGVCRCFIHKAFYGRTRQEIACNKCGFVSRTQEQMLYLTLNIQKQLAALNTTGNTSGTSTSNKKKAEPPLDPSAPPPPIPTMAACLEDLTALENLSDDTYSCRGCEKKGQMTKTVRIRKLPAILCMQVNRFQNEVRGGTVVQKKIKGRVQYPLEIDMMPYTTKRKGGKGGRKGPNGDGDGGGEDGSGAGRFLYELESVIVHEGKAIEQGHYFAFCRAVAGTSSSSSSSSSTSSSAAAAAVASSSENKSPPAPAPETARREWYMFNDAKVTGAAESLVLEQEAYLLFYSLKRICGGKGGKAG